jgi:hypothetical protein
MKYKMKKIISIILVVSALLLSACSSSEDEAVFSGNDKVITEAAFRYYYKSNRNTLINQYKSYYESYGSQGEAFKAYFGFMPDNSADYWENGFLNEKIFENGTLTVGQYLEKSTIKACKEYIVLEAIAKEYGYDGIPTEVKKELDSYIENQIKEYGSREAWNVATIAQYGLTADEIINYTLVSLYGSFLPTHIFGQKGEKISDEKSLESLKSSVQFRYSIYYYLTEDDLKNNEENSSEENSSDDTSSTDSETNNASEENNDASVDNENQDDKTSLNDEKEDDVSEKLEKFNNQYKEKMKDNYNSVLSGEKTFDEIYKDSDEYDYWEKNLPEGALLKIVDFENFFKTKKDSYKPGDVLYIESDIGVYLIEIVSFSQKYIDLEKEKLIGEEFGLILEDYFSEIEENKELISSLVKYPEN